jgi:hypothetical protein
VRTDFHAGTTWGAIGSTPVVEGTGERKTIMMVSAIGTRGQLRFRLHEGSFRAAHFVAFLKSLLADFTESIFLIVDGSSGRSQVVSASPAATRSSLSFSAGVLNPRV